jgi:hypothetical protein
MWNMIYAYSLVVIAFNTLSLSSQETISTHKKWAYCTLQQHVVICVDMYWLSNIKTKKVPTRPSAIKNVSQQNIYFLIQIFWYIFYPYFAFKISSVLHCRVSTNVHIQYNHFYKLLDICVDTVEIITWYG